LVAPSEITRLNERYLRHRGPTDVITFNYAEEEAPASGPFSFHGEIFICLEEALVQSRRYRTTWPAELVRYLVHGALHLCGYDDSKPAPRKRMKRAEDRLLREISRHYSLRQLAGPRRPL
jgi:probable rRNA maturation factor